MGSWIRKHRIGAFFLAVVAVAGMGGIYVLFYFTYWFSLKWASATGAVTASRHGVTEAYVYRRSLRSFTRSGEAGWVAPADGIGKTGAST